MSPSPTPPGEAADRKVFELALAALLHDVGKPLQRAATQEESRRLADQKDVFCPTDIQNKRKTHHHAAFTADFLDKALARLVPQGKGDANVVGWAARHHLPKSAEDFIVAEADRLSSGMDRGYTDESWGGWGKVVGMRLTPILARLRAEAGAKARDAGDSRFPLRPLAFDEKTIFPIAKDVADVETGRKEYAAICSGFRKDFEAYVSAPSLDLGATIQSCLAVLARYFWAVPAATNIEVCDVGLFDHLRISGALAANLAAALLDAGREGDDSWVRDRADARHALVCGDLTGLQGYISSVVSSGAARSFRGRSFLIQLLTDGAAQALVRRLRLPACNLVYSGGGHFWILAPGSRTEGLDLFAEEIDLYIQDWSGGTLGFGIGMATATGRQLAEKEMSAVRETAMIALHSSRTRRLRLTAVSDWKKVFEVEPVSAGSTPCASCGRDVEPWKSDQEDDDDVTCPKCRRAEEIGKALPRTSRIVRVPGASPAEGKRIASGEGWVAFDGPIGLTYALQRSKEDGTAPPGSVIFSLDGTLAPHRTLETCATGIWPIARNAPSNEAGGPLAYEDLARESAGVPRLAVLKADVDNMGALFRSGLDEQEASLSRLASISGHLVFFFAGRVNQLVQDREDLKNSLQFIYSGGDDLLVVGAFDRALAFGPLLREEFGRFAGGNPALTLSAGMTAGSDSMPVLRLVTEANEAEEKAKAYERKEGGKKKDAFAYMGVPVSWDEMRLAIQVAHDLVSLVSREPSVAFEGFQVAEAPPGAGTVGRGILHRLLAIARMHHVAEAYRGRPASITRVNEAAQTERWAWIAAYNLFRAAERSRGAKTALEALHASLASKKYRDLSGERHLIEYLDVPTDWALAFTRTPRN
jgi:CRISPR-associated protein Csm1